MDAKLDTVLNVSQAPLQLVWPHVQALINGVWVQAMHAHVTSLAWVEISATGLDTLPLLIATMAISALFLFDCKQQSYQSDDNA